MTLARHSLGETACLGWRCSRCIGLCGESAGAILLGKRAQESGAHRPLYERSNLFDQNTVTETLAKISANANELLSVALPDELFYYISGIDLENPCLYFPGGQDSVIAFVGLDNFLGAGYQGIMLYRDIKEY